ncbi:MAG: DUF4388 domain-containing protein [Acidimicrobiia bacterium]|nr:DUF4388 domain-containing protein [Acidimicrobiia bacterium]
MALTGRLESIPLGEVLRMLARSQKTGCLRVEAGGVEGKIYLTDGRLVYATTRRDDDLRSDLLNAGFVDTDDWMRVERREQTVTQVLSEGHTAADLRDFLVEQGTEVIFRLSRPGRGTFDFGDDVAPRYDAGEMVDVEICLAEADHRAEQWADIEEVIPGTKFGLRMAQSLPEGASDVTLKVDTWKLLAALGGHGTIAEVAHRTGTSEFVVAKAMANLVRQELITVTEERFTAVPTYQETDVLAEPNLGGSGTFSMNRSDLLYEDEVPSVDSDSYDDDVDDDDLLQSVLSGVIGEVAAGDDDSVEIVTVDYDADDDMEGTLSERAANLRRRRGGLSALARELGETQDSN